MRNDNLKFISSCQLQSRVLLLPHHNQHVYACVWVTRGLDEVGPWWKQINRGLPYIPVPSNTFFFFPLFFFSHKVPHQSPWKMRNRFTLSFKFLLLSTLSLLPFSLFWSGSPICLAYRDYFVSFLTSLFRSNCFISTFWFFVYFGAVFLQNDHASQEPGN